MKEASTNSPLLGYNTNVRHADHLFHIQTEDSGVDHPHVITHLFTEGTILASKKTAYGDLLGTPDWQDRVRQLMKDQHKEMFVELRDGVHDEISSQVLGFAVGEPSAAADGTAPADDAAQLVVEAAVDSASHEVRIIHPATMGGPAKAEAITAEEAESRPRGVSIFETPDTSGQFGESLISDKSLDEVILTYLQDDLDD
jgi:hypothetical protein